jgi:hypothetical protein
MELLLLPLLLLLLFAAFSDGLRVGQRSNSCLDGDNEE